MMVITIPRRSALRDWPAEKMAHGLRVVKTEVGLEPLRVVCTLEAESGEEIVFEEETTMMPPDQPSRARKKKRAGTLAALLDEMLREAVRNPSRTQRRELQGGLRIDLNVGIDGETRILLARKESDPSDVEWETVMANFPYEPPVDVDPERFEWKGWRCLRAGWETPGGDGDGR